MSSASNSHPPGSHAPDSDLIDLEPTMAVDWSQGSSAGSMTGTLASLAGETHGLRRQRLGAAALFLLGASTLMLFWNMLATQELSWFIISMIGVRLVLISAVAALLFSQIDLSKRQVHAIEVVLFGGLTLILCIGQYVVNVRYLDEGNAVGVVGHEKNGILQLFAIMMLYGMFIPNDAKTAAKVVFSIALAPLLVWTLLREHPDAAPLEEHLREVEQIGSNAVFVVIGAALSVYGAHILHGLRFQLHEAKRYGQYRLLNKLGSGGMGEVYLAEHELLKRPCALKLIKPESGADPVALARFEREVRSAARLSHPNSIEIFDYGHTDDGTFYYVMEYLQGMSLGDLIAGYGPLPPSRVIHLFRQICAGLAEAHSLGLVHRDLKPANVFVAVRGGETDVVKILDYGLVKLRHEPEVAQLTVDQTVSGTPMFMAPEQASADGDLDGRADIYAIGAMAYYALTGRPPFDGPSPFAIMIAHARDPVVPPSQINPEIPQDLEKVVLRCLEKSPNDRFADVKELSRALAACAAGADWDADKSDEWWVSAAQTEVAAN
ncbi:serine/threonine-protein kinase [Singulisphaera sp. PoT]|uniref:serine/threonine-protein kinase n=1 Tax=Singulisphaera sp. PoT TaxID=3411797 RepID=UPI003BF517B9